MLALARRDVRLRGWSDGRPDDPHRPGWHKLRGWDGSFTTAAWEPRTGTWTVYDLAAGAFTVPVAAPDMWRRLGLAYVVPCLPPVLAEGEWCASRPPARPASTHRPRPTKALHAVGSTRCWLPPGG